MIYYIVLNSDHLATILVALKRLRPHPAAKLAYDVIQGQVNAMLPDFESLRHEHDPNAVAESQHGEPK